MRTFLSATPDADSALAIHRWCAQNWPGLARPIAVQNYHLTLAFLGEISRQKQDEVEQLMEGFTPQGCTLTLDEIGYWSDAEVLWLGCSSLPTPFVQMTTFCQRVANRVGIRVSRKRFVAHVTLARKVDIAPAEPLIKRQFDVHIDGVQLMRTVRDSRQARYVELAGWYTR